MVARGLLNGLVVTLAPGVLLVAAQVVAPGRLAPDVRFQTPEGETFSLAEQKGKVVLVDFWASWCGPCKISFPGLDRLYQDLHARGLEVIAVNLDERRRDAEAFLATRPHAMRVVFDPDGTSPRAFGVSGMPTSVLIGRDGRIRFVHVGYSEKVLNSYRREIEQLLTESR